MSAISGLSAPHKGTTCTGKPQQKFFFHFLGDVKRIKSRRRSFSVTGEKMVDESSSSGGKRRRRRGAAGGGVTSLVGSTNRPRVIMTDVQCCAVAPALRLIGFDTHTHPGQLSLSLLAPRCPGLCVCVSHWSFFNFIFEPTEFLFLIIL